MKANFWYTKMKIDLDILFGMIICMLLILVVILFKETRGLQTQIDELSLVMNQKFLSSMIIDTPTIREEYGKID